MKASETRRLERAGIEITALGLGSAPFGGMFRQPIAGETAIATLQAAWDAGVRYFDTAPMYGLTRCEHLVGEFLREKDRDGFRLSTKVGRVLEAPVVLAALGVRPATGWLAGVLDREPDGGVVCGPTGRTSADGVWALGDAASWSAPISTCRSTARPSPTTAASAPRCP